MSTDQTNKDVVLSFLQALNNEDFILARSFVQDDLRFNGVLGSREGAAAYFSDMERMKLKYSILKAFEDGDDVCVLYDIGMGGKTIFSCGWYQLKDHKISTIRVVFDPRPLLENAPGS